MKYTIYLAAIILLIPAYSAHAASGGSSGGSFSQPRVQLSPEQKAAAAYESGIKHRDKAAKYEQTAATETPGKKLAKLEKKITREYGKAIKNYRKAIKYNSDFYEIHGSLGYALRKVGRFDESLAAYDESLRINPSYGNAVEYRGEAYLGLNRLGDAKNAYMMLFRNEPALANQLLAAMTEWVAAQRGASTSVDSATVENFAAWVQQRNELASFIRKPGDVATELWAAST